DDLSRLSAAMVHHQRLAVLVHDLAVAEPAAELRRVDLRVARAAAGDHAFLDRLDRDLLLADVEHHRHRLVDARRVAVVDAVEAGVADLLLHLVRVDRVLHDAARVVVGVVQVVQLHAVEVRGASVAHNVLGLRDVLARLADVEVDPSSSSAMLAELPHAEAATLAPSASRASARRVETLQALLRAVVVGVDRYSVGLALLRTEAAA